MRDALVYIQDLKYLSVGSAYSIVVQITSQSVKHRMRRCLFAFSLAFWAVTLTLECQDNPLKCVFRDCRPQIV